jgi:hypothetical protein
LNGIILVMDRTGRTRQIEYFIDLQIEGEGNIVPDDLKLRAASNLRRFSFAPV